MSNTVSLGTKKKSFTSIRLAGKSVRQAMKLPVRKYVKKEGA